MRSAVIGRTIGAVLLLAGLGGVAFVVKQRMTPAVNPDPNHTHADFAVWVDGQKLDFSGEEFMSEAPTQAGAFRSLLVPLASAHAGEDEGVHHEQRKYLHLHDGVGNVMHRHKPGLTIGEFFLSLGTTIGKPDGQALCVKFPQADERCDEGERTWQMVLNDAQPREFDPAYVFQDNDKILILYPTADQPVADQIAAAWSQMTDDACLYSRTCPWRGDPPAENCIADPTVPCVVE